MNDDLLVKHLLNEANSSELAKVEKWIAAGEANAKYYRDFKFIWNQSRQLGPVPSIDEQVAWKRFQSKIQNNRHTYTGSTGSKQITRVLMMAALFLLMAVPVILYYSNKVSPENTAAFREVNADQNPVHTQLPDGSTVILNKGSAIFFPSRFKQESRIVKLVGEAFFKVTANKSRPFIIEAGAVTIRVVGTSFNVRTDSIQTEVIVENGIVIVTKKDGSSIRLVRGDKVHIDARSNDMLKTRIADSLYNYYHNQTFALHHTPLARLVEILSQAYDVNISIQDPELNSLDITTTLEKQPLDTMLKIVTETLGVHYKKKGKEIILNK